MNDRAQERGGTVDVAGGGVVSLRKAINAKCKDCIYDPLCGGGTWREQVAQCSALKCPLWVVRPMPQSGPYAGCPTKLSDVPNGWVNLPVGWGNSRHPTDVEAEGDPMPAVSR